MPRTRVDGPAPSPTTEPFVWHLRADRADHVLLSDVPFSGLRGATNSAGPPRSATIQAPAALNNGARALTSWISIRPRPKPCLSAIEAAGARDGWGCTRLTVKPCRELVFRSPDPPAPTVTAARAASKALTCRRLQHLPYRVHFEWQDQRGTPLEVSESHSVAVSPRTTALSRADDPVLR